MFPLVTIIYNTVFFAYHLSRSTRKQDDQLPLRLPCKFSQTSFQHKNLGKKLKLNQCFQR